MSSPLTINPRKSSETLKIYFIRLTYTLWALSFLIWSKWRTTKSLRKDSKTWFISMMKVSSALDSPNSINNHMNSPLLVFCNTLPVWMQLWGLKYFPNNTLKKFFHQVQYNFLTLLSSHLVSSFILFLWWIWDSYAEFSATNVGWRFEPLTSLEEFKLCSWPQV